MLSFFITFFDGVSTARDDVYQGMSLVLEKLVPSEKEQSWLSQGRMEH